MTHNLNNLVQLSQFGMSGWEYVPGGLVLLFLIGGCVHILKAKEPDSSLSKERRKEALRVRLNLPMIINTPVTQAFSVSTYDISISGAFIPLFEMKKSMNFTSLIGKRSGIKIGDLIDLKLQTGRFSQIYCQGRVIRLGQAGEQTEGLGIQFVDMSRRDKKRLENLLSNSRFSKIA